MSSRVLVVNADDLGRTRGINAGIFEAHARGVVTSATLMVNYPAAENAAAELERYPNLGVGLHCQLTGGHSLLPAAQIPSLVEGEAGIGDPGSGIRDPRGRFPAKPELHGELELPEVLAELEAQLARFIELVGRPPTHLDSHHHSHRLPVVTEALARIAKRIGVPVRRGSEAIAARLAVDSIDTTDTFIERFFGDQVTLEVVLEILDGLKPGTTELMCHPARVDVELERSSSYVVERERELVLLTDPTVADAIRTRGIELAHFGIFATGTR